MPEGLAAVVIFLAVGYLFLFLELFLPGGVLGILGAASIVYACYVAFGLSAGWGMMALVLSLAVALVAIRLFTKSKLGKSMFLVGDEGAKDWKASEEGLERLEGKEGTTLTPLRPAGVVEIDQRRIDVVADSEFLDAGQKVRVCRVEGNRVVVEPIEEAETPAPASDGETSAEPAE